MEQRVLRAEQEMAQANSDKDVAKTELNMKTVEKIELEERIKALQREHEHFKEKVMAQSEEFDKLIKEK